MIDISELFVYNKNRETALTVSQTNKVKKINRSVSLLQGGYFFMTRTIIITNKAKEIMYSIISPPFTEVSKQPSPFLQKIIT